MKKIVVMSDSHGYHQMIDEVREREPDGDYYVHCGDSEAPVEMMRHWLCVKGNNDWYSDFNDKELADWVKENAISQMKLSDEGMATEFFWKDFPLKGLRNFDFFNI